MGSNEAIVVVAIDFGTTFSGCAFAHRANPSKVYTVYQWPDTLGTYCKTRTELYYTRDDMERLVYKSWGVKALMDYTEAGSASGELIQNFKLHLAGSQYKTLTAVPLPGNLTTDIVITDYLREMSKFIMDHLQSTYGSEFSMQEVQWCLTVPAIWDDGAKQLMKYYAEAAGLVQTSRNCNKSRNEGSPYPPAIILEPEAAAMYCLTEFNHLSYEKGDKFMTADLGGGTVDIVIHEKVWQSSRDDATNLKMREVAKSSGGLCGATYVDKEFIRHLGKRIPCFGAFTEEHPSTLLHILKWWEVTKINFNGTVSQQWPMPADLAEAWRKDDQKEGRPIKRSYVQMEFTLADLKSIFEPVVKRVIELIEEALRPFAPGDVKTIMAVGGFSGSPYLKKRLRETFRPHLVKEIVTPPNPGGAICVGAAMLGIAQNDPIVSRVSRKTYGIAISRFWKGDDRQELQFKDDDGVLRCDKVFKIYVRKEEDVPSDYYVTHTLTPLYHNAKTMHISIYSSGETTNPKYTTEAGMVKEREFELDISSGMHLVKARIMAVTMYFGRSSIEVTAKGENFKATGGAGKAIPVSFKGGSFAHAATHDDD